VWCCFGKMRSANRILVDKPEITWDILK
jgi:hypothetical protein